MKLIYGWIVVLALTSFQCFAQQPTGLSQAQKVFLQGKIAEQSANYSKAFQYYQEALTLTPDNPEYLDHAAYVSGMLGFSTKKAELQARALRIYMARAGEHPANVSRMLNRLASSWQMKGDQGKANHYFELARASERLHYQNTTHEGLAMEFDDNHQEYLAPRLTHAVTD